MQVKSATTYRNELLELLNEAGLPFKDLPENLENFVVAIVDNKVIAAAGIEHYGANGLVRSVVVKPAFQRLGIAGHLLNRIEENAIEQQLAQLFILTETAGRYFKKKGYAEITRAYVPESIKASSEYSQVCPESALVMYKSLIKK